MKTFLAMGGYGGYIWGSYGLVFLALMGYAWSTHFRCAQDKRLLEQSMTHDRQK